MGTVIIIIGIVQRLVLLMQTYNWTSTPVRNNCGSSVGGVSTS